MIPGGGGVETKRPVDWIRLPEGKDWLMRPVLEKMCLYESLKDCTLDLADLAEMNDALDAKAENEKRYRKANE